MAKFLFFLMIYLLPSSLWAEDRYISFNLCTDEYLLVLHIDKKKIVSLSPLISDCSESVFCKSAKDYDINKPDPELILARHPTDIFDGAWSHFYLEKIAPFEDFKIHRFKDIEDLDHVADNIIKIGMVTQHQNEALKISRDYHQELEKINSLYKEKLKAAILSDYIPLLLKDMIEKAGFSIMLEKDAEKLILNPPDILIDTTFNNAFSISRNLPSFILNYFKGNHLLIIQSKNLMCALPHTILISYKALVDAHDKLIKEKLNL